MIRKFFNMMQIYLDKSKVTLYAKIFLRVSILFIFYLYFIYI